MATVISSPPCLTVDANVAVALSVKEPGKAAAHRSVTKPSYRKWASLVRTSVIASRRIAAIEMQSVRLWPLSGRAR